MRPSRRCGNSVAHTRAFGRPIRARRRVSRHLPASGSRRPFRAAIRLSQRRRDAPPRNRGAGAELSDLSPLNAVAAGRVSRRAPRWPTLLDTDRRCRLAVPYARLRVPDRVTAHLLGDDNPDPALADVAHRTAAAPLRAVSRTRAGPQIRRAALLHPRNGGAIRAAAVATADALWAGRAAPSCAAMQRALAACRDVSAVVSVLGVRRCCVARAWSFRPRGIRRARRRRHLPLGAIAGARRLAGTSALGSELVGPGAVDRRGLGAADGRRTDRVVAARASRSARGRLDVGDMPRTTSSGPPDRGGDHGRCRRWPVRRAARRRRDLRAVRGHRMRPVWSGWPDA